MLYDIAVIGGGINGAGIALEAASRGLSVLLCEQSDLASGTSSKSSKLAHGGIRYLEHFAFSLVKESLRERDNMLRNAPHLVYQLPFIIPVEKHARSNFLLRLGLWCYDCLNFRGKTRRSHKMRFESSDSTNPIKRTIQHGFKYYDCWVDDARLVVTVAQKAHQLGATILTQTALVDTKFTDNQVWTLRLKNDHHKNIIEKKAKVLINATGPWLQSTIHKSIPIKTQYELKQVKGSHIVLPKLYEQQHAYLLQNIDGRVIFTIPFYEQFTLIGTTDCPNKNRMNIPTISEDEIKYLCQVVNRYFHKTIKPQDIVYSFSGIRGLWNDKAANLASISRECKIETINSKTHPTLVNVYGGKLTTYRSLGEKVINDVKDHFPNCPPSNTKNLKLPGAFEEKTFDEFLTNLRNQFGWLPCSLITRLAKCYGKMVYDILQNCQAINDLGRHFGHGLYEKEVRYLMEKEWAKCSEDILWRRTKLGLYYYPAEIEQLDHYIKNHESEVFILNQAILEN